MPIGLTLFWDGAFDIQKNIETSLQCNAAGKDGII